MPERAEEPVNNSPTAGTVRITAFYGFKGGAGRSFLLATSAVALAASGRRVLVLDWDLEAPGVGDLFDSAGNNLFVNWRRKSGIIDLFDDPRFPPGIDLTQENEGELEEAMRATLLSSSYMLRIVPPLLADRGSELSLIGPGRIGRGTDYLRRFLNTDWPWFFERGGRDFFKLLRAALKGSDFDDILIDARTGYSAFSIAVIRWLADAVCVIGTYSIQSIDGVARVWPALHKEGTKPVLITSRVPIGELKPLLDADIRSKRALLASYLPEVPRFEFPVISELHAGDGHLWSRAELERTTEASRDAGERQGRRTYDAYVDELGRLLEAVFELPFVPELDVTTRRWWKTHGLGDNSLGLGDNSPKAQFGELRTEVIQADVNRIADFVAASQARGDALSEGVRGVAGAAINAETIAPIGGSLPARALGAALAAGTDIDQRLRDNQVSLEEWPARVERFSGLTGADIAASEDKLRAVPEVTGNSEGAAPREDARSKDAAVVATLRQKYSQVYETNEWFARSELEPLANVIAAFRKRSHAARLGSSSEAIADAVDALRLCWFILRTATLIDRPSDPLSKSSLASAIDLARGLLTKMIPDDQLPLAGTLRDCLSAHERISWILFGHLPTGSYRSDWQEVLHTLKAKTPSRGNSLDATIRAWSKRALCCEVGLRASDSAQRGRAAQEIAKLALAYVRRRAEPEKWKLTGELGQIGDRLAEVCTLAENHLLATQCLLVANRGAPAPHRVFRLATSLASLQNRRGTTAAIERVSRTTDGEAPDGRIDALANSYIEFTEWNLRDKEAAAVAGHRACLDGLNGWFAETADIRIPRIRSSRQGALTFALAEEAELGRLGDDSELIEVNAAVCITRARLLLENGNYDRAKEELGRVMREEDSGPLSKTDPKLIPIALTRGLRLLIIARSSPDDARQLSRTFAEARRNAFAVSQFLARRPYPFDRELERVCRSGFDGAFPPRSQSLYPASPFSFEFLGVSSGADWPSRRRLWYARSFIDYAEISIRCERLAEAERALRAIRALLGMLPAVKPAKWKQEPKTIVDALDPYLLRQDSSDPASAFTRPLAIRMALMVAISLALQGKVGGDRRFLRDALKIAAFDCSPEVHGPGRKVYYRSIFALCGEGTSFSGEVADFG